LAIADIGGGTRAASVTDRQMIGRKMMGGVMGQRGGASPMARSFAAFGAGLGGRHVRRLIVSR